MQGLWGHTPLGSVQTLVSPKLNYLMSLCLSILIYKQDYGVVKISKERIYLTIENKLRVTGWEVGGGRARSMTGPKEGTCDDEHWCYM